MTDPRAFALVVVETAHIGRMRNINSVAAAAQMLLFEWPEEGRGPAYRSALRTCLAALEGKATDCDRSKHLHCRRGGGGDLRGGRVGEGGAFTER